MAIGLRLEYIASKVVNKCKESQLATNILEREVFSRLEKRDVCACHKPLEPLSQYVIITLFDGMETIMLRKINGDVNDSLFKITSMFGRCNAT